MKMLENLCAYMTCGINAHDTLNKSITVLVFSIVTDKWSRNFSRIREARAYGYLYIIILLGHIARSL